MSLSWIQSLRVAAPLEDCVYRLDIMAHTMMVHMTRKDGATTAQEKHKLVKLTRDCQFISKQITLLKDELQEHQSFTSMLHVLEEAHGRRERAKRDGLIKQRKRILLKELQEVADKTKEKNDLLALCEHLENSTIMRKQIVQERTLLGSRMLQNETRKTDTLLMDQHQLLKEQLTNEVDLHENLKLLLHNRHGELQRVLQEWKQRSQQMLQEKQKQLDNVCCKRTLNLDRLLDMRMKFRKMEKVMIEDRDEQEKLRQLEAKGVVATKLQAWWRGVMVRQGFGPFRKVEVETKDKKKKKKKSGKKKK